MYAEQAIERYGPLVMSLIWRINGNHDETADLYQEVFVKFHETTSERGPLQQPKAWLCRTAINAAIDFNRQRARFVPWSESAEGLHNWETDDALDNGLMVEKIRRLTVDLPERRREVFVLRYFQGCSFEQIARLLNCSAEQRGPQRSKPQNRFARGSLATVHPQRHQTSRRLTDDYD